jgi:hypothetical protein
MRGTVIVGGAVLILFVVVVGSTFGLLKRSHSKSKSTTAGPPAMRWDWNDEPDVEFLFPPKFYPITRGQHLWPKLPRFTQKTIMEKTSTPQEEAFHWMVGDPAFETYRDDRLLQRFALATFYFSLIARSNRTWLAHDVHECHWTTNESALESKDISSSPCRDGEEYLYLQFYNENLEGTLPPELGLLTSLVDIDLSNNALAGSLPSELGLLEQLTGFFSFRNNLSGTIPSQLGNLEQLSAFSVAENPELYGIIPENVLSLAVQGSLTFVDISGTTISGTIPTELCSLDLTLDYDCGTKLCGCDCGCTGAVSP